jgi:hypothetical protein
MIMMRFISLLKIRDCAQSMGMVMVVGADRKAFITKIINNKVKEMGRLKED